MIRFCIREEQRDRKWQTSQLISLVRRMQKREEFKDIQKECIEKRLYPKQRRTKFYYGRPREIKIFESRIGKNVGEMDLCQKDKFTGRECHKDNQASFKVMQCKRKSDIKILDRYIEKKMLQMLQGYMPICYLK